MHERIRHAKRTLDTHTYTYIYVHMFRMPAAKHRTRREHGAHMNTHSSVWPSIIIDLKLDSRDMR